MGPNDAILKRIYEEEDDENIVLSIREELMAKVMEECHQSYLKKQTVKFVVQCAYDAIVKYLSFEFYYHPMVPDLNEPTWIADRPIDPSPKDSWACDAVPVRPPEFEEIECEESLICDSESTLKVISKPSSSSSKVQSKQDLGKCCCLEHVCTCTLSLQELSRRLHSSSKKHFPSKKTVSSKSSKSSGSFLEKGSSLPESVATTTEKSLTTKDSISKSPTTDEFDSKLNVDLSVARSKKWQMKKKPKTVEVGMEVPDGLVRGSLASLVDLPPIRVNSTFHSKPVDVKTNIK